MINFEQHGIYPSIRELADAVAHHTAHFQDATWRQRIPGTAHADTETIYLRMPPVITPDSIFNSLEVVDCAAMFEIEFVKALREINALTERPIARAMIVKLKPGGRILPHRDEGKYADATERFHLPITTDPRVWMRCGDERRHLAAGIVTWFNKHIEHEAGNDSPVDRIHLIVDTYAKAGI